MTTRELLARKCALIGAGAGLVLYAIFGLLQGAVIGGTAGVLAANWIFGPGTIELMGSELITRVIVGGAMLTGVVVSLIMFLTVSATAGYICGSLLGMVVGEGREEKTAVRHAGRT